MFVLEFALLASVAPFFSFFGGTPGKKKAKATPNTRAQVSTKNNKNNPTKKSADKQLAPESSSEEDEQEQEDMEHEPVERAKNKRARSDNTMNNSELLEAFKSLQGTVANQQEIIDNLQREGTRANISISENEAHKALPTSYPGPAYLLDRSRFPSDIWTASVAASKTMSVLINSGGSIPHDHPLLASCRLQAARCARLAAAAIGGLQAAAHIEQGQAGKMADMYYAHLRTTAIRDPTDKNGDLDEDKLIPENIVFVNTIKNEIKDSIEQSERSKASTTRVYTSGRGGGRGYGRGNGQQSQSTPNPPVSYASNPPNQSRDYNSQPGTSYGGGRGRGRFGG